jgi:hypothetical protein
VFLRNDVLSGEQILSLAKQTVLKDAGREQAALRENCHWPRPQGALLPTAARLDPAYAEGEMGRGDLGIRLTAPYDRELPIGQWLSARDLQGSFLSLIAPEAIASEILRSRRDRVNALDASAVVFYTESLLLTDVARTLMLFYLMPAWGALLEFCLMGRRLTLWRGFALLLSLAGLVAILGLDKSLLVSLRFGDVLA